MLYTKVGLPLTLRRLRKQRLRREKALSGSGRLSIWKFVRGSRTTVKQISARALIKPYVLILGLVIHGPDIKAERKSWGGT